MKCIRVSVLVLAFLSTPVHGGRRSDGRESKFLRKHAPRNLLSLVFRGSEPNFQLSRCEGDCDDDSDCIGSLICYQKTLGGTGVVPGCSRTDTSNTDFCVDPADLNAPPSASPPTPSPPNPSPIVQPSPTGNALFSHGREPPSDVFPLGVCEGDCDVDGDCAGGLVCYQRDSGPVPGCSGTAISNLDYCIRSNASPVAAPTPAAPAAPTTSSGPQDFKLKLYWEPGYFWQEESFERKWCMRCLGGSCSVGEKLYIEECDDDGVQRFDFDYVSSDEILIKLHGTNQCLERSNKDFFVRDCNSGKSLQRWWAKDGNFDEYRFEISQKAAANLCMTQRHHPKAGEDVHIEPCTLARSGDTSFWERCYSDSC